MNEIICPSCKKAFKIDEAGFADILKQVRDQQFEDELKTRLHLAEKEKESAVKLAEATIKNKLQEEIAQKDKELAEFKFKNELAMADKLNSKDAEISKLQAKIDGIEVEKKLAITEAVQRIEKERDMLTHEVRTKELEKQNLESTLKQTFTVELQQKDVLIRYKDEEIARGKEMKSKLSTKMIGEKLEQHCEAEFNKLRAIAFPNAYFEKDNDIKSGSKYDHNQLVQ